MNHKHILVGIKLNRSGIVSKSALGEKSWNFGPCLLEQGINFVTIQMQFNHLCNDKMRWGEKDTEKKKHKSIYYKRMLLVNPIIEP